MLQDAHGRGWVLKVSLTGRLVGAPPQLTEQGVHTAPAGDTEVLLANGHRATPAIPI